MTMSKEEFRRRWDGDENGGGITNDDCADCYVAWGLGNQPFTKALDDVVRAVCQAAGCQTGTDPRMNAKAVLCMDWLMHHLRGAKALEEWTTEGYRDTDDFVEFDDSWLHVEDVIDKYHARKPAAHRVRKLAVLFTKLMAEAIEREEGELFE